MGDLANSGIEFRVRAYDMFNRFAVGGMITYSGISDYISKRSWLSGNNSQSCAVFYELLGIGRSKWPKTISLENFVRMLRNTRTGFENLNRLNEFVGEPDYQIYS